MKREQLQHYVSSGSDSKYLVHRRYPDFYRNVRSRVEWQTEPGQLGCTILVLPVDGADNAGLAFYTAAQACTILEICTGTLRNWVKAGKIRRYQSSLYKRLALYSVDEVNVIARQLGAFYWEDNR